MAGLDLSKVKFTNNSDTVNPGTEIFNPKFSYVDAFKGNDTIIGTANLTGDFALTAFAGSAANGGKAIASTDLSGKATVAVDGIKNEGIINTSDGGDILSGTATANITATAQAVSQSIATAQKTSASAIAKAFASINVKATADGIDNSRGVIYTGQGSDTVNGGTEGAIGAVAVAIADASAIVEAICKAPISEGLRAFAGAMATSIAQATITATGIKNIQGIITTGDGKDTLSATATSSAVAFAGTLASASAENKALAQAVVNATASAFDQAIAIDNTQGLITTGSGDDTIKATASATDKAIAINNTNGFITTGDGNDIIKATATGSQSYGIFGGSIDTGDGNDQVIVSSFGGGVNIDLGDNNDFVQGFGDAKVNGGQGSDILSLGAYNINDFQKISFGANNSVIFQLNNITMTTTGFEQFNFANNSVSYAYNNLPTHA